MTAGPSSSSPASVPASHAERKPRTIVLCFDGTGNQYNDKNTNVVKLYSLLRKDRELDQICYYQPGVGTYFAPGVVKPMFRWPARMMDEGFAWYLSEHIVEGYKFLMQNYHVHDRICLFGFSRGAYTARALAGMLQKVGLLSKDNMEQVFFAYKLYKKSGKKNKSLADGFKKTFCRSVTIDFVGVWDTVASVGFVRSRSLPFVDMNGSIRVFRQALSLDEHRSKFRPSLYQRKPHKSSSLTDRLCKLINWVVHCSNDGSITGKSSNPNATNPGTDQKPHVKEVWFAGCHCDVGGGNALDEAPHALSNIPLRWMIEQIVLDEECKILFDFDSDAFDRCHVPRMLGKPEYYASQANGDEPPTSENLLVRGLDKQDAVQRITDEMRRNPFWWPVEFFFTPYRYPNAEGERVTTWLPNFFLARRIEQDSELHTSVQIRKDANLKSKYTPRAYCKGKVEYKS